MSRIKGKEEGFDPVDVHVGAKVRARRLLMGFSQDSLAKMIGLTFQQIQKYERGTNRISVSRLIDIAKALKVPVNYFFGEHSEFDTRMLMDSGDLAEGFSDIKQDDFNIDMEPLAKRDVIELIKAYSAIGDQNLKKQLLEMAKTMAKIDSGKN